MVLESDQIEPEQQPTSSEPTSFDASDSADFSMPPVLPDLADGLDDPADTDELQWQIDEVYLKEVEADLSSSDVQVRKESAAELRNLGNEKFRVQQYKEACQHYTEALKLCPLSFTGERSVLYCNRAACFVKMEMSKLALEDCNRAVDLDPNYEKAFMRRAQLYSLKDDTYDKALADYQTILKLNPRNFLAVEACQRLPSQIAERNERLKDEMLGKLKELGNVFLRPFGLSTDNFKLEPSESGGYSVKIQK